LDRIIQVGIEEVGYSLLWALVLLLCCFSGCNWKDRVWHMLVAGVMVAMPLYGCAAGHVMVASYEDESAKCAGLEKELGVAQARMQKLKATDSTDRNIRNFFLGVGGFIIPPLGIINAALLLTDSYAADYTEEKTLKNRYNNMVMISQRQGCGTKYALIPIEAESKEPNA
jgi:peptidoglycan/LPS O-acetylase OafA/YrhL